MVGDAGFGVVVMLLVMVGSCTSADYGVIILVVKGGLL